jgi:hypothetical protein
MVRLVVGWKEYCRKRCYVLVVLCLTYGGVHLFWCPADYSFWVIQLIPLSVLLFMPWNSVTQRRTVLLLVIVGMHFGLNLMGNIIPKHLSPAPYVKVIHSLRESTTEDDLFILLGLIRAHDGYVKYTDPNVDYFLGRKRLTLPQIVENGEEAIDEIEDRLRDGKSVYLWWDVTPGRIERLPPPYSEAGRRVLSLYRTAPAHGEGEHMIRAFVPK